jgi:hypothetical protein
MNDLHLNCNPQSGFSRELIRIEVYRMRPKIRVRDSNEWMEDEQDATGNTWSKNNNRLLYD